MNILKNILIYVKRIFGQGPQSQILKDFLPVIEQYASGKVKDELTELVTKLATTRSKLYAKIPVEFKAEYSFVEQEVFKIVKSATNGTVDLGSISQTTEASSPSVNTSISDVATAAQETAKTIVQDVTQSVVTDVVNSAVEKTADEIASEISNIVVKK